MTKKEKIVSLKTAMTQSKRNNNENDMYYHFTNEVPDELKSVYLEHYEVRDIDYEVFAHACDILTEIYSDKLTGEAVIDAIYERSADSASVYTSDRLGYLNIWNESEISDYIKDGIASDIQTACAIWYDAEVEKACLLINEWINS